MRRFHDMLPPILYAPEAVAQIQPIRTLGELDRDRWELDKIVLTSVIVIRAEITLTMNTVDVAGTARAWNPARFLRRITIEDTGERGRRLSISGELLYKLLYLLWGRPPSYTALADADIDEAGTATCMVEFPIPMYFLRGVPAELGVLVSQGSAPIFVEVETGDEDDLAYGATWDVDTEADISVHQVTVAPNSFDASGYGQWILSSQVPAALTAGENRINLTPYKRTRLIACDCFAGADSVDVPSDAVLERFLVRHGGVAYPVNTLATHVRGRLFHRHGLPQTPRDDAATPDWCGFYCWEFGKKDRSLDTALSSILYGKKISSLEFLPEIANPVPEGARIEVAELYLHGED